jgi:DNA polymerase delta subunit 1
MLQKWRDFVEQVDPDIVIGYNIANFDLPYLIDRANALQAKGRPTFPFLGRLKGECRPLKTFHGGSMLNRSHRCPNADKGNTLFVKSLRPA